MKDDIQQKILNAILISLRPIAKILLRHGIGFREFSEISKSAFVDVATSEYGLRGRPTNISRVAIMTGLTRKEVSRVREKISKGGHTDVVKTTPLNDVLDHWFSEDGFVDASGQPSPLKFSGETKSFSGLVRLYGGDIPPGAMRTELKRFGAVIEDENGNLVPVKRTIHPKGTHEKLVASFEQAVYPLISTIAHNVDQFREDEDWPQISVMSHNVRPSDVNRIRRVCFERLSEAAESVDDLFVAYETLHEDEGSINDGTKIGVGVFYYEEQHD